MGISILRECISLILIEGRVEDAKAKHPDLAKQIDFFVQHEPSNSNSKYLDWELKILSSGQALEGEISDVVNLFDKYSANLKKRDLNQYGVDEFTDLRDQLFALRDKRSGKKEKAKERYAVEGDCEADVIYEDDEWKVLRIKNKAASVHYGLGAKWCISMKNENYFEQYSANNTVFFFALSKTIKNDDPSHKIAISIERDLKNKLTKVIFWNALDQKMGKSGFTNVLGDDEASKIKSAVYTVARSAPKSIVAKIKSGEATPEECELYYDAAMRYDTTARQSDQGNMLHILCSKNVPLSIWKKISENPNHLVRMRAAFSEHVPLSIIKVLAHDESQNVRAAVSRSPSTPPRILDEMASTDDAYILGAIAGNSSTSRRTLDKLSHSLDTLSRPNKAAIFNTLLHNSNTSSSTLDFLFEKINASHHRNVDSLNDEIMLRYFAIHRNLSTALAMKLLEIGNFYIRRNVLQNSDVHIPIDVLEKFVDDPESQIRIDAAKKLEKEKLKQRDDSADSRKRGK